jgi:type I restriction enzyme, S subunit
MKYQTYDKYKDSGVEWLGLIPQNWRVSRLKDNIKFFHGYSYTNDDLAQDTDNYLIRISQIQDSRVEISSALKLVNQTDKYKIHQDDLLIALSGATSGKVALFNLSENCYLNQRVAKILSKKYFYKYLFYFFKLDELVKQMYIYSNITAQPNFTNSVLEINNVLLDYDEQVTIACYLDKKTALIDKKIELLEKKEAKYIELKQSLINDAVTKGLDKNVEMKESGIEWVGKIPKHWEVKRLKDVGYLYSGLSGKSGKDFKEENNELNKPYIPFTNIAGNKYIQVDDVKQVVINRNEQQNVVKKGDIFFLMSSEGYEDIGRTSLLMDEVGELYLNSFCKGFRITNKRIENKYLNCLLLVSQFRSLLMIEGKGFTRINLKMEKISGFSFLVPPKNEQAAIAKYLDEESDKIKKIVDIFDKQISTLQEFRKTLINDVVTGKVKVT